MPTAYAVIADVQAELKGMVFSANTTPTDTDVTRMITEAQAEIDARIGARYSVPIDVGGAAAASAPLLRLILIGLLAPRIKNITALQTKASDVNQAKGSADPSAWARKMLEDIQKGDVSLSGATLISSTGGVESPATSICRPHQFERDPSGSCPQW